MKLVLTIALFLAVLLATGAIAYAMLNGPSGSGSAKPKDEAAMKAAAAVRDPSKAAYSTSGYDITPLTQARIDELARKLTPDEAKVILKKGTEPAFCGNLTDNKKEGTYICRLCDLPLFASTGKFDSGSGWPSFFKAVDADHVDVERDTAHGMTRTEILCARCHGHLGHVFDDAPQTPTGLRFCVNSASLAFVEKGQAFGAASLPVKMQTAYFAGGCFWGVEDRFQQLPGVVEAVSGYMGGKTKNPTYEDICSHTTGHAEVVKVEFDPARVSYAKLLEFFFKIHDPTQLNRQGPDVGDNYRSHIFADTAEQAAAAKAFVDGQQSNPRFKGKKVVTLVSGPEAKFPFYEAEDYHQDYHVKNGGHCAIPEP
ncbi:MAG: bifunctional methionine sulfoxide reductase B/A protein [Phycisphaerales bacterium]